MKAWLFMVVRQAGLMFGPRLTAWVQARGSKRVGPSAERVVLLDARFAGGQGLTKRYSRDEDTISGARALVRRELSCCFFDIVNGFLDRCRGTIATVARAADAVCCGGLWLCPINI